MNLSDLAIKIGLDLKDLKKGVTDANKELSKISEQSRNSSAKIAGDLNKLKSALKFGAIFGGIGLAVGAATKSVSEFTMEALRMADAIGDNAKSLDMSAESFQSMEFAAGMAGMKSEQFTNTIRKMNEGVGRMMSGDKNAAKMFEKIGLSIDDLAGRSPEEIFKRVTGAIGEMGSAQQQAAAVAEIFGSKNKEVLNIIREGPDAFQANIDKAQQLGYVLSNELVEASGKVIDEFDAMKNSLGRNAQVAFIQIFKPAVEMAISVMERLNAKFAEFNRNRASAEDLSEGELFMERNRLTVDVARGQDEYNRNKERVANDQTGQFSDPNSNQQKQIAEHEARVKRLAEINERIAAMNQEAADHEAEATAEAARVKAEIQGRADEEAATRLKAQQERRRAQLIAGARDEEEVFAANIEEINNLFSGELANTEEHHKVLEAEINRYLGVVAAANKRFIDEEKAKQAELEKLRREEEERLKPLQAMREKIDPAGEFIRATNEQIEKLRELGATDAEITAYRLEIAKDYISQFGTAAQQLLQEWGDVSKQMEKITAASLEKTADAFTDFLMTGKMNFGQFSKDIIRMIMKMIVQQMIFNAISGAAGSSNPMAASIGNFLGGGKAGGGVIQPGKAYPVGERGTELVMPQRPSRVLNNHVSGQQGAQSVKVEVVNRGTPQQASDTRVNFDASGMIVQVVLDDLQRGGKLASGMGNMYGLRRRTS